MFIHVSNWGNWYGSSGTSIHANSRVHYTCSYTCLTGETGTVLVVRVFTRIHVFIHVSNWGNWYGSSGTSIHANSRVHTRV